MAKLWQDGPHFFGTATPHAQHGFLKTGDFSAGTYFRNPGGEEMYVISGQIRDDAGLYPAGTWLRQPPGSAHCPVAVDAALLWVKSGHLG